MNFRMPTFFLAAMLLARTVAAADGDVDRVFFSTYWDMLRDAGIAYENKNYDKAFHLFQRTACAGDKQSQSAIGRMYLMGQGVQRDDLTGYAWLSVAAESVFPGYQSIVRRLADAMTPAQHAIADPKAATLMREYRVGATHMSCSPRASQGGHITDQLICTPRREGNRFLLKRCVDSAPH